jgi:quercetin dioxygenase-like cupin family protein
MQTEAATKANYTVKNIEVVAKGADIQARIFTLAPGEVIPWHRHSEILITTLYYMARSPLIRGNQIMSTF